MKQTLVFIVGFFLIFALVTQGGMVDIGVAGFVAVLVVSFLISKYYPKILGKTEES
jgi:4-amino-4-deoxy-L-arabinose transferase-like glycosyltransferase